LYGRDLQGFEGWVGDCLGKEVGATLGKVIVFLIRVTCNRRHMARASDLEEIYFVIEKEEGFPIEEVKVSRGGSGKEKQMGASSPLPERVKRLPPRMMMRSFRDSKSALLAKVSTGGTSGRSTLMMRLRTLSPRRLIQEQRRQWQCADPNEEGHQTRYACEKE
jgi:hypothetical protein